MSQMSSGVVRTERCISSVRFYGTIYAATFGVGRSDYNKLTFRQPRSFPDSISDVPESPLEEGIALYTGTLVTIIYGAGRIVRIIRTSAPTQQNGRTGVAIFPEKM